MVDQMNYQGYAGTKRQGSPVMHSDDDVDHIVQTTKSKGIVNVQLFIRSKSVFFRPSLHVKTKDCSF